MPDSSFDRPESWGPEQFEANRKDALGPMPESPEKLEGWLGKVKNLIEAYRSGYGTEPDPWRYFELLKRAAAIQEENPKQGLGTGSLAELAYAYKYGEGVQEDESKFLEALDRAARAGDQDAMLDLADHYRDVDQSEFRKWTERLAESDPPIPRALIDIAVAHRGIEWGQPNENKHIKYARSAVSYAVQALGKERGEIESLLSEDLPDALMLVAHAYRYGIGVTKDFPEYFKKLDKAASAANEATISTRHDMGDVATTKFRENTLAPIQEEVALAYEQGIGVAKNLTKAFANMKCAAENGLTSAKRQLGLYYKYGSGTKKNLKKYFRYVKYSAQEGDVRGMYECGRAHGRGHGTSVDAIQSFYWIDKAVRAGHDHAYLALGLASLQKEEHLEKNKVEQLLDDYKLLANVVATRKEDHELKQEELNESGVGHFTSVEAMCSMLPRRDQEYETGDLEPKNEMRLYNIQYLNDPQEGQPLLEQAENGFEDLLSFYTNTVSNEPKVDALIEPLPLRGLDFSVYVGSFTLKTDRLDLWRAYGNDGDGYCIVTPYADFEPSTNSIHMNNTGGENIHRGRPRFPDTVQRKLYKVFYTQEERKDTLEKIRPIIAKIVEHRDKFAKKTKAKGIGTPKTYEKINLTVREILSELLYLYKNDQYESEKEVRIISPQPISSKNIYLDERTPAKLYVKTEPFLFRPNSKIILGPKVADPVQIRLEIKKRLDQNRCDGVGIQISTIKYR